jgi:hypothetical protein
MKLLLSATAEWLDALLKVVRADALAPRCHPLFLFAALHPLLLLTPGSHVHIISPSLLAGHVSGASP